MEATDWYRAVIVFKGTPELVARLSAAVSGQEIVDIAHIEVFRCDDLQLATEPEPVGLHVRHERSF
jgi:hypothetical protein